MPAKPAPAKAAAGPDTTITHLRTTLITVPWAIAPPPNGIMAPKPRDYLQLEIITKGGIVGMGYLMPLRGGLDTLDACIKDSEPNPQKC